MPRKMSRKVSGLIIRSRKNIMKDGFITSGIGEPSVYHAVVVIFLEFFAWGLLTTPMITVLNETFPDHTFLMNGLIVGVKGFLSFLSAPLVGALSDVWGRKVFLLLTVFFTCSPIPLMRINTWWYFAMISISGVFAVTFSVVFAYVADVTEEQERSSAYGLVSATFAASLVTSPALGAYLSQIYSDNLVVALASAIALLDVFFILVAVPESLPEKLRPLSWGANISWEHADPFSALKKVGKDQMILMLCMAVFLSYLPEAGQYSCFFVYLRLMVILLYYVLLGGAHGLLLPLFFVFVDSRLLYYTLLTRAEVMGFSAEEVALFIAIIGLLSVVAQTIILTMLMKTLGSKNTIMVGLFFEMLQLMWYGFGSQRWMMWAAGGLASVCSITYPAISSFVSTHAEVDKQGVAQGMITGMRGLCNGLGPAVYGFIFYLFHVDLNDEADLEKSAFNSQNRISSNFTGMLNPEDTQLVPGPPFVFGAFLVMVALLVAAFIPDSHPFGSSTRSPSHHRTSPPFSPAASTSTSDPFLHDMVHKRTDGSQPLLQDTEPL